MAQNLEVIIDANLNQSSYLRAFSTTAPSDNAQNDDNVTVTINEGKTVTMGSGGYLHIQSSGSTNTINTISAFGNYTYNINGTLDMRSTGTTAIVAHSTKPSVITINTNGTWLLGNAMRVVTAATAYPAGSLELNIGTNGVVDAAARTVTGSATNLLATNATIGLTEFFNITGGGVLKSKVVSADMNYPVGSGGTYSPVRLFNSGAADIVSIGVATGFDKPVTNAARMVNKQFVIMPSSPATTKLDISLGWLPADQGTAFTQTMSVVQARYDAAGWIESSATVTGVGTMASPYYAKAAGNTNFGSFVISNPAIPPVVLTKNYTAYLDQTGNITITPADIDNGSSDDYAIANMAISQSTFGCSEVGDNTVTLTVTDIHGNEATGTAIVTVRDTLAPAIAVKNVSINLLHGKASITAADIDNGSADACGIKSIRIDKTDFDCSNIGANEVTLTVIDMHDNMISAKATVTIVGVIPQPGIEVSRTDQTNTGANANTVFLGYGAQELKFTASDNTSALSQYDWTPAGSLSATNTSSVFFAPQSAGNYAYSVTATNEYGCSASAAVTAMVINVRCGKQLDRVLLCHKGKEYCVEYADVKDHLAHGDKLGSCISTARMANGLEENYKANELNVSPNPANAATTVTFTLMQAGKYKLELYNINGNRAALLQQGASIASGMVTYQFDAKKFTPGLYLVKLVIGNSTITKQLVIY
jgi:hypothetical protein